jgi:autoinducer 2-degrading protein
MSKPSFEEESTELSALVVKIHMKAEYREQFLEQMWADAIGSEKNEPGCLMFNIVQDNADPNVLHLFEVYRDDNAVEAHKKAAHVLKWLETTRDWLAAPLEVARCTTVYPPAGAWSKRPVLSRLARRDRDGLGPNLGRGPTAPIHG